MRAQGLVCGLVPAARFRLSCLTLSIPAAEAALAVVTCTSSGPRRDELCMRQYRKMCTIHDRSKPDSSKHLHLSKQE